MCVRDIHGAAERSDLHTRSQVPAARSMALMDKHKQVKRQRLDRICEGEFSSALRTPTAHETNVDILLGVESVRADGKSVLVLSLDLFNPTGQMLSAALKLCAPSWKTSVNSILQPRVIKGRLDISLSSESNCFFFFNREMILIERLLLLDVRQERRR